MSSYKSNIGFTQLEPLLTLKDLKEKYLFGIVIVDSDGNKISDKALQHYINSAISIFEHDLDIAIMPRTIVEDKDYNANDYWDWGYFQLNHYPVLSVDSMKVVYLKPENNNDNAILEIPDEWIRLQKDSGIIRLIPNNKFPATLQVGANGAFFPELFRQHSMVPDLWEITYTHGFDTCGVPPAINSAIGMLASLFALSIAGNLILGAGIAGSSISLDSLSQSIQTTQSAENSGYSATRKEYQTALFGSRAGDPTALIEILRRYYKGATIQIV